MKRPTHADYIDDDKVPIKDAHQVLDYLLENADAAEVLRILRELTDKDKTVDQVLATLAMAMATMVFEAYREEVCGEKIGCDKLVFLTVFADTMFHSMFGEDEDDDE